MLSFRAQDTGRAEGGERMEMSVNSGKICFRKVMTRKTQGGLVLVILLAILAIRCSLSIGLFGGQTRAYEPIRGPGLGTGYFRTPAPSPSIVPVQDGNSSRTVANSTISPIRSESPSRPKGLDTPKVEPVWRNLASYLKRSGVSKDAAKAREEGLRVWQELHKSLIEEATNRSRNNSRKIPDKCPYSVSASNATELKPQPFVLPIPCGLVLDSSITVVGTPYGKTGEFSFELKGSKLLGEADEPVVLHFSARMHGDQMTDSPVIVQNTWTSEDGWQKEERCPVVADDDPEQDIVDGLKLCNPDLGRKVSRKAGAGLWKGLNVLEGASSAWYPFNAGFPFVATLQAGWDGFHVSVNGKHVTSFKYRQSLEPWMVTKLSINGDLEPTSVIVNGLPISDDASLIPDLKAVRAPKLPRTATLFIGVFSTNTNFLRRMAVRRTWMQYPEVRNGTVVVRFFVGLHREKQFNNELWTEAVTYGDMQILPIVDYYNIITFKTLAICMYATMNLKTRYVMKTDDDTFVRVDAVLSSIFVSKHNYSILLGNIAFSNNPERNPTNKWFVSTEEWNDETYPPWAHGPGYIFSEDIARFVVEGHEKNLLKDFKLEDVAMGIWVDQYRRKKQKRVDFVNDETYNHMSCEPGYTIAHYQSPGQMQCLWNHIMKGELQECCPKDI